MTLRDDALRVAALTALRDEIDKAISHARTDLGDQFKAMYVDTGVVPKVPVSLPDGPQVATTYLSTSKAGVRVTDEQAFTEWVVANYPGEVEIVTQVRPAFRKALLDRLVDSPPDAIDPATGVVADGVEAYTGGEARSLNVRFEPEGRAAIAEAWRAGRLQVELVDTPSLT